MASKPNPLIKGHKFNNWDDVGYSKMLKRASQVGCNSFSTAYCTTVACHMCSLNEFVLCSFCWLTDDVGTLSFPSAGVFKVRKLQHVSCIA